MMVDDFFYKVVLPLAALVCAAYYLSLIYA